jgi:hypothetical protein
VRRRSEEESDGGVWWSEEEWGGGRSIWIFGAEEGQRIIKNSGRRIIISTRHNYMQGRHTGKFRQVMTSRRPVRTKLAD